MAHLKVRYLSLKAFHRLAVLLMLACFVPIAAADDDLNFICNKNVAINTLSKFEVKNIFLGKHISWDDNKEIIFVVLNQKEPFKIFLKKIIHKSPSQYESYWRHMVFTGKGVFPKTFTSEAQLIDYVAKTDGAIGYLSSKTHTDKVKILVITN